MGGKEGKIRDTTKKVAADDSGWGDVGGENMEDQQARTSGGYGMEGGATPSGDAVRNFSLLCPIVFLLLTDL